MEPLELTAAQARVLGSLVEKSATTPESYPLTLKALTAACNQSSNRDPVTDHPEQLVETTALALKGKGLVRVLHPARGERSTRYRHVAQEAWGVSDDELAVLAVMLLRGPQTVAELRTRTERYGVHASALRPALDSLAERTPPMVELLERAAGQKEPRWRELLGPNHETGAAAPSTGTPPRTTEVPSTEDTDPVDAAPGSESLPDATASLERRLEQLEQRVAELERRA